MYLSFSVFPFPFASKKFNTLKFHFINHHPLEKNHGLWKHEIRAFTMYDIMPRGIEIHEMAYRFPTAFNISPAPGSGQVFQIKKKRILTAGNINALSGTAVQRRPRESDKKVHKFHTRPFFIPFLGLCVTEMSESWVLMSGRLEERRVQICSLLEGVQSLSKVRRVSGDPPSLWDFRRYI
jgi:hypothetical protein